MKIMIALFKRDKMLVVRSGTNIFTLGNEFTKEEICDAEMAVDITSGKCIKNRCGRSHNVKAKKVKTEIRA